jgi:formamidopyrimidine-DNA glycosylase
MPELPEVETIARDLTGHILNRRITTVEVFSAKTVSPRGAVFKKNLLGRKITKIARRGKLLILSLLPQSGGNKKLSPEPWIYLLIHLKMTGQLIYIDKNSRVAGGHSLKAVSKAVQPAESEAWSASVGGKLPNSHTRALLKFNGGGQLFFNDLRKFGYLKLATAAELEKLLKNNYGPEPLTPAFSFPAFSAILKNKKTKIKALLLDQKAIAGLGNIYVDETLYAARLKPTRAAGSLKPAEIRALWLAINRIIGLAIKHRGTTFSDYVDSRGRPGNFSRFLRVYGRSGEKCPSCHGPILKTKVAGRGTHYCPNCQK